MSKPKMVTLPANSLSLILAVAQESRLFREAMCRYLNVEPNTTNEMGIDWYAIDYNNAVKDAKKALGVEE